MTPTRDRQRLLISKLTNCCCPVSLYDCLVKTGLPVFSQSLDHLFEDVSNEIHLQEVPVYKIGTVKYVMAKKEVLKQKMSRELDLTLTETL